MKNDTISRAAVVDEIEGVEWYHINKCGEMVHGANDAEHQAWYKADDIYAAIERVPSAQPDVPDTNVGDTINRQAALDALNRIEISRNASWYEFYQKAITAVGELPSAQRWIPVTEKLPEMTDTYLVQVGINENGEGMHTEARTADWNVVWQTWYVHTTRCLVGDIIKWMPIPWEGSDRHE